MQNTLQIICDSAARAEEPNKQFYTEAAARLTRMYDRLDHDDEVFETLCNLLVDAYDGLDAKIRGCLAGKEINLSPNDTRWISSTTQLQGGGSCFSLMLDIHRAISLRDIEQLFASWVSLRRKLCPVVSLLKRY